MRWSFGIGRIGGVRVQLHVTLLAYVAWVAVVQSGGDPQRAASTAALLGMVFACVLLHELAHAFAASRYGIRTQDIVLLPIGGIARLERMPERPAQELAVAVAGPAMNLAIAGILYAFFPDARGASLASARSPGEPAAFLLAVNVIMVVFNLIPAFPMDGGRVLRALLATIMPFANATRAASGFGQAAALGLAMFGLFEGNATFVAVALFVFLAAAEERALVEAPPSLAGVPVRDAMLTDFVTLDVDDPLQRAVDYLIAGSQADFPVLEGQVPIGTLGRAELLAALQQGGLQARAGSIVKRDPAAAAPGEPLAGVLQRMRSRGRTALPVLENGRVVGLVTIENIGDLVVVNTALKKLANAA